MRPYYSNPGEVNLGFYGWLNRLLLWLIGLAVFGLVILKYVPLIQKNVQIRENVGVLREQVRLKVDRMQENDAEIRRLQSDPRAVEREARERLGQSRGDEWLITF